MACQRIPNPEMSFASPALCNVWGWGPKLGGGAPLNSFQRVRGESPDADGCWFALQAYRLGALPSISTERCCSSKAEHAHGKREGFSSILISSSGGRESTCFGGASSDGHHAGIL